ncbi:glycerophosphodiester phosphodiesterase [Novosphingobium acidiphilum]|uniref:glycerophosphodiester phosphodiesterase n=1 Tax=Novosphingobium acidiphilum TaxID=505248 RepID=UPI0003F4C991|nr:glycerophosphodiester phosphodiesterase [Novosphingobium acidiphilum]
MRMARRDILVAGGGLAAALLAGLSTTARAVTRPVKPVVLGHRGCSALRPEHTLGSYAKAIADGADYIEPDLVVTKDGVLVARHENNIAETTDVAAHPEFAARKTTKLVDGVSQTGWFTEDFTLDELRTLRARERMVGDGLRVESHSYDGMFRILTLAEIGDFLAAESAARGRTVGLIPEIKHSTYFAGIGLTMEDRFVRELNASRYLSSAPVILQSFEIANLKSLRGILGDMPNVQFMQLIDDDGLRPADVAKAGGTLTYGQMMTADGLAAIAAYADWVAPWTRQLIPLGAGDRLAEPKAVIADAHRCGLLVGCYTFRPENQYLAADFRNDAGANARNPEGSVAEIRRYVGEGLDGFFTDDPALGRRALDTAAAT